MNLKYRFGWIETNRCHLIHKTGVLLERSREYAADSAVRGGSFHTIILPSCP
jgi:hypothetical protein